jgi:hypothetical protein
VAKSQSVDSATFFQWNNNKEIIDRFCSLLHTSVQDQHKTALLASWVNYNFRGESLLPHIEWKRLFLLDWS